MPEMRNDDDQRLRMKIAITAQGENMESMIDQRFGRCRNFIIVEDGKMTRYVANEGAIQGHGAGIRAAEQVGELGAEAVITGELGPKATDVLGRLGIPAYHASGDIKTAVEQFSEGNLGKIHEVAEPKHDIPVKEVDSERIFFPLLDNNGKDSKISEHFGHAPFFGIFNTVNEELRIIENDLDHADPTKSPIDQIEEAVDPTTIFAKGIGGRAIGIIQQKGLRLKTGNFDTVGEALQNLDNLEDQVDSCGHEHNH
jgi:predicted Fe-Mo cluster-binding NifX family protein